MRKQKYFLGAILALMTTFTFSACNLSLLFPGNSSSSSDEKQDILLPPPPAATTDFINSLDKLNYYSARKTVDDYLASQPKKLSSYAEGMSGESIHGSHFGEDHSEIPEQNDNSEMPTDSTTDRPQDTEDKVYYDLYEWGSFTVKRTIYFQIELSGEGTFLTERLGTGIVEVAIAIGDIYDDLNMITFRNGDKFFSCMYHGYNYNDEDHRPIYTFAAYRYIEGFYYVKNLKYEHFEFNVQVGEEGDAVFTCDYRATGTKEDTVSTVKGSTYYIDKEVTYTIEELEAYFNPTSATPTHPEHSTIHEGEWQANATHHWLACTCGENVGFAEHTWDDGIEVESGTGAYVMEYTCTFCGEKRQEIITIIPMP